MAQTPDRGLSHFQGAAKYKLNSLRLLSIVAQKFGVALENKLSREEKSMPWTTLGDLAALILLIASAVPLISPARAEDDPPTTVDDRFANEPNRPKSRVKNPILPVVGRGQRQAKRTGHRLLAYFTSDNCGWCRVLEKRSFTDAEVVELSKQFVCVEVNISEEQEFRLADKYRIDSIPRTIIFTPDGNVIERSIGYIPAAEYAAWLKGVGNTVTATVETRVRDDRSSPRRIS